MESTAESVGCIARDEIEAIDHNLMDIQEVSQYFDSERIQRSMQRAIENSGLSGLDEKSIDFLERGLYQKLKEIIESVIEIARRRQMMRGLFQSRTGIVFFVLIT